MTADDDDEPAIVSFDGDARTRRDEQTLRREIAAEIERQIDPDWPNDDVSDAYRHAAMIAAGTL
jgi:hypothetical protein